MAGYVARRLAQSVVVVIGVLVFVFVLLRVTGDPAVLMLPPDHTYEDELFMRQQLGLDQPLPLQLGRFLLSAAQGDFGTSLRFREQRALPLVVERFPATLERALDPAVKAPYRSTFLTIEKVDVLEKYTVNVVTKGPDPLILARMSIFHSAIVPPGYFTRAYESRAFLAFAHPDQGLVIDPEGSVVARARPGDDQLVATVELDRVAAARATYHGDVVARRRPSVYARAEANAINTGGIRA